QRYERFLALQRTCDRPLAVIRDVRTRWNSTFDMCERAVKLQVYIDAWLQQEIAIRAPIRPETERSELDSRDLRKLQLGPSEWHHIRAITRMLKNFKDATLDLSSSTSPQIQAIWSMYTTLFDFLDAMTIEIGEESDHRNPEWPSIVRAAAAKGREKLSKYYAMTADEKGYLFNMATVLDPTQKLTVYVGDEWEREWKHTYRNQFVDYTMRYRGGTFQRQTLTSPPPSAQRSPWYQRPSSTASSLLSSFGSQGHQHKEIITLDEANDYLEIPCVRDSQGSFDLLNWWRSNASNWPYLHQVAKDVLAIPIAQVGVERTFNIAREVIGV
ncbi:uncharacterized protein M421DRAFT_79538, partial [Didymella exigua CBS 183.55]